MQLAFVLTFYFLQRFEKYQKAGKEKEFYNDCMRATIREGGDTDTNAAIVGGMIGAIVGLKGIPAIFKTKLMEFDCVGLKDPLKLKRPRPSYLSVQRHGFYNIQQLVNLVTNTKNFPGELTKP